MYKAQVTFTVKYFGNESPVSGTMTVRSSFPQSAKTILHENMTIDVENWILYGDDNHIVSLENFKEVKFGEIELLKEV